jgi:chemotaxis protein CheD
MSHFLLSARTSSFSGQLDGRYAEEAISLMLGSLKQRGVAPEECQAKLFGGGNMFPLQSRAGESSVGHKNGHAARRLMQDRGIPIISESLFGDGHRRIIFDIDSGTVWSRQVDPVR